MTSFTFFSLTTTTSSKLEGMITNALTFLSRVLCERVHHATHENVQRIATMNEGNIIFTLCKPYGTSLDGIIIIMRRDSAFVGVIMEINCYTKV